MFTALNWSTSGRQIFLLLFLQSEQLLQKILSPSRIQDCENVSGTQLLIFLQNISALESQDFMFSYDYVFGHFWKQVFNNRLFTPMHRYTVFKEFHNRSFVIWQVGFLGRRLKADELLLICPKFSFIKRPLLGAICQY